MFPVREPSSYNTSMTRDSAREGLWWWRRASWVSEAKKGRGWAAARGVKKKKKGGGADGDVKRALRRELAVGGGRGVWINLIRGGGEQSAGVGEAPVEELKAN